MKICSTNLGNPTTFTWNGRQEQTGIFKRPVAEPLQLTKTEVAADTVVDRVHHAGVDKACYLFSADHYPYWKDKYPSLDWNWGMFGENLTVSGLDESHLRIGDIFRVGTAVVQVSQPREPCYKLGIRFGTQQVLKQFIDHARPGTYVRILEEGQVNNGDQFVLEERSTNELTVELFYRLLYLREKPKDLLELFMDNPAVPQYKKDRYQKYVNS